MTDMAGARQSSSGVEPKRLTLRPDGYVSESTPALKPPKACLHFSRSRMGERARARAAAPSQFSCRSSSLSLGREKATEHAATTKNCTTEKPSTCMRTRWPTLSQTEATLGMTVRFTSVRPNAQVRRRLIRRRVPTSSDLDETQRL